jgi:ADP-ribosylglycohydrolase
MALCLAESLITKGGFDPVDQLQRYVQWWRHGHLSSTGTCFDIGTQTSSALRAFELSPSPYPAADDPDRAGNGSIMRLAPVPLFYAFDVEQAIEYSGLSSRTTHPAPRCVDACRYLGALIAGAADGLSGEELLNASYWHWGKLDPEIQEVAQGAFKRKRPPDIKGTGFVVSSLEAALWALHNTKSFREGALLAVNLGDDADTTGAVYGQLAGTIYGENGIPSEWLDKLSLRDLIVDFADALNVSGQNSRASL